MPLDSALKRASALNVSSPWRGILPLPDGTVSQADRQVVAFLYSGISAAEPVIVPDVATSTGGRPTKRKKPKYQVNPVYLRDKLEIEQERKFLSDVESRIKELTGIVEEPVATKHEAKKQKVAEIGLLARVNALSRAYSVEIHSVKEAVKLIEQRKKDLRIEQRKKDLRNEEAFLAIIMIVAHL